jgi:DNA helicase-2/ATP-dependent DNA helicase PcrA
VEPTHPSLFAAHHPSPATTTPSASELIASLNDRQREAVTHPGGAALVLAGAGSGKTRVITHRIAWLVLEQRVAPEGILAVTFTNKAAAEMRERVRSLLGHDAGGSWIGTFHALCLRILRRDGEAIGLKQGFNVYDTDDQLALVKRIMKSEGLNDGSGTPRSYLSKISKFKNSMQTPEEASAHAYNPEREAVATIFRRYEEGLRRANAADFDDLLVRTLELFRKHPQIAESYSSRCEHLLVDEYQDTNRPQYLLVRMLGQHHGNVFVVGDEDQSIYRFRGAEIRNILDFENDHEEAAVIRLEQNYRSTSTIIQAAGAVIANNKYRKGKTLWTENPSGEKIEVFCAPDDRGEAIWISRRLRELNSSYPWDSCAILYRTNAQSRQLEEIFRRDRIPYQIVGSVQFYDRKEIKDLLSYLKLAANPSDDVAFRRVVNTPSRGIGDTSFKKVEDFARTFGVTLYEAAPRVIADGTLTARASNSLTSFMELAGDLVRRAQEQPVAALIDLLVERLNYSSYLEKSYPGQGHERMENVHALISAAVEYAEEEEDLDETAAGLTGFLDRSALVADADEVGKQAGVTMMTVHCAKGLEFPVVVIAGMEENLFPHAMSVGEDEAVEEERRLCYVAMTRARKRLFLTHAQHRRMHGAFLPARASRFLEETPTEYTQEISSADAGFFGGGGGGGGGSRRDVRPQRQGPPKLGQGSSAVRLVKKKPAEPNVALGKDPGDGYPVGARVMHPRFGGGKITQREGHGKNLKLTIHFSEHGPKKILPSYTKLSVEK